MDEIEASYPPGSEGAPKASPRPYRLDAYDQLWERLMAQLDTDSLSESTRAEVALGLLLAAGLYRIERAIGMATDQVYDEGVKTLTQNGESK